MDLNEAKAEIIAEIMKDESIVSNDVFTVYRSKMREAGWVKSDFYAPGRSDWRLWRPFSGKCPLLKYANEIFGEDV